MADYQGTDTGSGANAVPTTGVDPQWVQAAQTYLASGGQLDNSGQWDPAHGKFGTPPAYKVDGNQLVPDNNLWGSIWPGLLGVAGMGGLGALIGPAATTITPATQVGGFTPATVTGAGDAAAPLTSYGANVPAIGSLSAGAQTPSGLMALAGGGDGALTSPLMKSLAGLGGVFGGALAGKLTNSIPSQLNDLLNLSVARAQAQNPLFNAANLGTYTQLPNYAKVGGPPKAVS